MLDLYAVFMGNSRQRGDIGRVYSDALQEFGLQALFKLRGKPRIFVLLVDSFTPLLVVTDDPDETLEVNPVTWSQFVQFPWRDQGGSHKLSG